MSKANVALLTVKLHDLLAPLEIGDREKVIQAARILLGDDLAASAPNSIQTFTPAVPAGVVAGAKQFAGGSTEPGAYFDQKNPQNKGEALAVAARFREQVLKQETHSKAELKKVVTDARRNFDDSNFARDMNNARRQAGFFNSGTGRDSCKLSYYGQQFVDALPDREAAGQLNRPKVGGARKKVQPKQ